MKITSIFYKLLILSIFVLITFFTYPINAYSYTGKYARIIDNETPFFTDSEGENLLFYLPYTYYVSILDETPEFTHVLVYGNDGIFAVDGYIPTNKLFYDGLAVESPYLNLKISTCANTVLYADTTLKSSLRYIFKDRTLNYYGKTFDENKNVLYCVGYSNLLGYVKESDVYPFEIKNHQNELTFIAPEIEPTPETPEPPKEEQTNSSIDSTLILRLIIIGSLSVAGIIALIFAIKYKSKPTNSISYYDENDYE